MREVGEDNRFKLFVRTNFNLKNAVILTENFLTMVYRLRYRIRESFWIKFKHHSFFSDTIFWYAYANNIIEISCKIDSGVGNKWHIGNGELDNTVKWPVGNPISKGCLL